MSKLSTPNDTHQPLTSVMVLPRSFTYAVGGCFLVRRNDG